MQSIQGSQSKCASYYFPNHRLHKIFNLSTIKLSCSCMSNVSSYIKQHNRNILSSSPNCEERSCNCRNKKHETNSCLLVLILDDHNN